MNKNKPQVSSRTKIAEISDDQLDRVPGGAFSFGSIRLSPLGVKTGTCLGTTYPGSVVNPGEVDTVTDEKTD